MANVYEVQTSNDLSCNGIKQSGALKRGRILAWAAVLLTPVAAVQPVAAQSTDCAMLRARLAGTTGDALGIAADYPKTHAAIMGCLMSQDTDANRNACAGAIIVGSCIAMGSEDCNDLTSRWARAQRAYQAITVQMRQLGCRP